MSNAEPNSILIIDFGSQYTQLIARRIRECGVYSIVKPNDITLTEIKLINPKGIVLTGGPESVQSKNKLKLNAKIFNLSIPVLGICYGMQLISDYFRGKVSTSKKREFGHSEFKGNMSSQIFNSIKKSKMNVWMSHGDKVTVLPNGFKKIGSSTNSDISAIADEKKQIFGLQFHPEVTHTDNGKRILNNFVINICKCKKSWLPKNIVKESIYEIRKKVGNNKVLLALSGGVDSSVVAALLNRAIGKQLTCIFINTGLLRKDEVNEVQSSFKKRLKINLITIDSSNIFFKNLESISDPEKKRKVIGKIFIEEFEKHSKKIKNIKFLAQGTIYPDVIESSGRNKKSDTIKSHHNVGGLPKNIKFTLIEPLKSLFKDEVKKIGEVLGLPKNILNRHPFPGPGLAVRILGKVSREKVKILQQVDYIFIEELKSNNLYNKTSQALSVFLPIKAVGVMGDKRQYNYVVALRAVKTIDFMTASISEIPYKLLNKISTRIVNEVNGVARVVYDITSKPPGTIEWE
tara:strand:- start:14900 stop:16450 length:1551 start_codon:yes stop_codon:yes gene_type:complete